MVAVLEKQNLAVEAHGLISEIGVQPNGLRLLKALIPLLVKNDRENLTATCHKLIDSVELLDNGDTVLRSLMPVLKVFANSQDADPATSMNALVN
jgi:hypothetical protein